MVILLLTIRTAVSQVHLSLPGFLHCWVYFRIGDSQEQQWECWHIVFLGKDDHCGCRWNGLQKLASSTDTIPWYTISTTLSHGRSLQWISHEEEPGLPLRAEHATLCRTVAPIFSPPLPRSFVILPFLCIHFYCVDHGLSPTTMCLPTHEKILWTSMRSRFLSFMHLLERELRVSLFISPKLCKRHLQLKSPSPVFGIHQAV